MSVDLRTISVDRLPMISIGDAMTDSAGGDQASLSTRIWWIGGGENWIAPQQFRWFNPKKHMVRAGFAASVRRLVPFRLLLSQSVIYTLEQTISGASRRQCTDVQQRKTEHSK